MLTQTLPPAIVAPASTCFYRVSVGGYEEIQYPDGTVNTEFVLDSFIVELPEAYLGLGHRHAIYAEAAELHPDKSVIDWWLCKAPANEF